MIKVSSLFANRAHGNTQKSLDILKMAIRVCLHLPIVGFVHLRWPLFDSLADPVVPSFVGFGPPARRPIHSLHCAP